MHHAVTHARFLDLYMSRVYLSFNDKFSLTAGILTVSSTLTIGTDADLKSDGLNDHAETCGCWKSEDGDLNFAKAFATEYGGISLSDSQRPENRLRRGRELLENMTKEGKYCQNNKLERAVDGESSQIPTLKFLSPCTPCPTTGA